MEPTAIKVYGPEGKTAEIHNSPEELELWAKEGFFPKAESAPATAPVLTLDPPATGNGDGAVSMNLSVSGQAPDPAATNEVHPETNPQGDGSAPVPEDNPAPKPPESAPAAPVKKSGPTR